MRLRSLLTLIAVSMIGSIACGSDESEDPAQEPPSANGLLQAMIQLDDLPAGWYEVPASAEPPGPDSEGICDAPLDAGLAEDIVSIGFAASERGPTIMQAAGTRDAEELQRLLKEADRALSSCDSWETELSDGTPMHFAAERLPFTDVGDESLAFRLSPSADSIPLIWDIVFVRRRDVASVYFALSTPSAQTDLKLFEAVVVKSDDRLAQLLE